MEIYILDYFTLQIKSINKPIVNDQGEERYEINVDEETNATSEIYLEYKEGIKKGNYLLINGLYKQFLFIISGVDGEDKSQIVKVSLKHISNIFDKKIIEEPIGNLSIEEYIKRNIEKNYTNTDDRLNNLSYINIIVKTNTQALVKTNSEDGLFNLHTYMTNCRQYKNIRTSFIFKDEKLNIYIERKENKQIKIDTNVAEILEVVTTEEEELITKVEAYVRNNKSKYYLYLKSDRTTTENPNDTLRIRGKTEVITADTLENAKEEALNTIRKNRYKHLIEFKIPKRSNLIDVETLEIGDEIQIRVKDVNYFSYISGISIKDNELVYFKSRKFKKQINR